MERKREIEKPRTKSRFARYPWVLLNCLYHMPLRCASHLARFPGVFFLFGRELGGRHGVEQKGARRIVVSFPALLSCRASPQSPVHNGKMAGLGPGKERRRQGTWLARTGVFVSRGESNASEKVMYSANGY